MNSKVEGLYIVATPIGNLADISYRAVETLKLVDRIWAEDSRHARILLDHYGIRTAVSALHEHNERKLIPQILAGLGQGEAYALISDAGTPLVSDPGFQLVHQAQLAGIQAQVVPGPCAAIAALSVSGLATDRFAFEGFLPHKAAARLARLEELRDESRSLIFYEAKHRILASLSAMEQVFGPQRQAVVARELTKKFESVISGELAVVSAQIQDQPMQQKGEFVVLIAGQKPAQVATDIERVLSILLEDLSVKQASKLAAKLTGMSKNACYDQAIKMHKTMGGV